MKTILLALLMFIPTLAFADGCPPMNDELTVCDVASSNAASISENLPMRLSDGVIISGAEAVGGQIRLSVGLKFTEADMVILIIDSGATPAEMKGSMEVSTMSLICQSDELKTFVNAGGEVAYTYILKDGSRFHHFVINECY